MREKQFPWNEDGEEGERRDWRDPKILSLLYPFPHEPFYKLLFNGKREKIAFPARVQISQGEEFTVSSGTRWQGEGSKKEKKK